MTETLPSGLPLNITVERAQELSAETRDFVARVWVSSRRWFTGPKVGGKAVEQRKHTLQMRANNVLANPSTHVAVANFASPVPAVDEATGQVLPEVPIGFAVVAPNLVHFAYVRSLYRGLGVARLLFTTLTENYAARLTSCPFPAAGWVPCTQWATWLPEEGWRPFGARVLFYSGFEPIRQEAQRDRDRVEVRTSA